ncbi:MAG: endolytic transglycosylase MltG [Bacillota bacterium]
MNKAGSRELGSRLDPPVKKSCESRILIVATAITLFSFAFCFYFFGPLSWAGKPAVRWIRIEPGTPAQSIGRQLARQGIIRSAEGFHWYILLAGKAGKVKAGSYMLSSRMWLPKIVAELEKGHPLVYRVTFPEGLTIKEMAQLLEERKVIPAEDFLACFRDKEFMRATFGDINGGKTAEGFLFPDTYEFEYNTSSARIINKMAGRFRAVVGGNILKEAAQRNLTPLKLITLASLVEKEARKDEERPVIAAVFLNRLRKGMPLASCASVQYVLERHKEVLSWKDTQIDSPYNTYLRIGLPPGPIANPGLASIRAVLEPAPVDYLYFVARRDGYHIFSRTYKEHLAAGRRLKRERPQ